MKAVVLPDDVKMYNFVFDYGDYYNCSVTKDSLDVLLKLCCLSPITVMFQRLWDYVEVTDSQAIQ